MILIDVFFILKLTINLLETIYFKRKKVSVDFQLYKVIIKHFKFDLIIIYRDIVRNQYFMCLFEISHHLTIKAVIIKIIIKSLITVKIKTIDKKSTNSESDFIKFDEFIEFKSENIYINRDDSNNSEKMKFKKIK